MIQIKWCEHSCQYIFTYRERLALRRALRGGRTEAFRLMYDIKENPDKELRYGDVNSLYPYSAIYHDYPTGLPETFIDEKLANIKMVPGRGFIDVKTGQVLVGLVQLTILPPDSLFLPALPVTVNGKMKFGLCATCMEKERQDWCPHSDSQRALTDTWTTAEVEFAVVECGYKVVKYHEFVLYRNTQPVFRDFYLHLARIKLESEGFPEGINTEEEKDRHVQELNALMPGLDLDRSKVERNEGRRQFAKDCSNTGLGKLSQDDVRKNVGYASSWVELSRVRYSHDKKLQDVHPITPHLAEYTYTNKESFIGPHRNVQVVLYAFVTAFSRIKMLKDMRRLQQLGCQIYYTDTDSAIFDIPKDCNWSQLEEKLKLGSLAYGCYKWETNSRIQGYTSLGPKNYSIIDLTGQTMIKVRGFTLRHARAQEALNHQKMKEFLLAKLRGEYKVVETSSFSMKVDRQGQAIKNITLKKKYTNQGFDKRWIPKNSSPCVETYPYGAKHGYFADLVVSQ